MIMQDFVDTKPFGATCTGLAAAITCYVAGSSDWLLIASPLAVVAAYYLFFSASESQGREFGSLYARHQSEWLSKQLAAHSIKPDVQSIL
jgi:hypothetical protein